MKYLIAIDIHGTLLRDNDSVSDYTIDIINELKNRGHYIILCTGGARNFVIDVNKKVGGSNFIICSSGTEVYNIKDDFLVNEISIDQSDVKIVYNYVLKNNIRTTFFINKNEYVTRDIENDYQILLTKENINVLEQKVREIVSFDLKDKIIKGREVMMFKHNMNVIYSSHNELKKQYFGVLPQGVNKGYGVNVLANYLDIKKENIISFGNDKNDISMFKESNIGYAVSNSTKELLDVADYVIESNNEDAVAKCLSKMIGNIL